MSKTFVYFIETGYINRALRVLSENSDNGVLHFTDEV